MSILVSIFIFLSCTAYVSGQSFAITQGFIFKIGILTIWLTSLCIQPKRRVVNLWFNALVGLAFIQTLLLQGEPQTIAINSIVMVFLGAILYYTLSNYLLTIKPILDGICWAVGAQGIMVLLQILGLDPICLNDGGLHNTHMVGLFGFKYLLGSWMALACPVLLFNKRKTFGILAGILCLCSMSWASVGILILTLVASTWFINRRIFIALLSISILAFSIAYFFYFKKHEMTTSYLKDANGNYISDENGKYVDGPPVYHPSSLPYKIKSRVELEAKLLPIMCKKPLTGFGLGCFKYIGPTINTYPYGKMSDAWNDYIERSTEVGLGFIVIFLWLCWDVIKRFKRSIQDLPLVGITCALLTIPAGMLFHDLLNHSSMNTLIICVFSAFTIRSDSY